ncbi:DUF2235 domain-containing protein [Pseudoduganella plicata]|uniref:DUF2235 domain-containing protein n=1 Tax=Pseudoduganella plicata TaxID=321984 RepID=A0ABX5S4I6_9BURK|nr:DUF2235 domain-containing protein [Pseudoduganella plicata]QBQ35160.1 DUF2235 domain-containing protein [Pseudoduganella plicata]
MILPTPKQAPFPVESFFALSSEEKSKRALSIARYASSAPCAIPIRISIFFDGTNNNLLRDRDGQRIPVLGVDGSDATIAGGTERLPTIECSHSNVARLFGAHTPTNLESGIFSYYIPGVGTPFPEIGELTESAGGKAFAAGGEARIIFALLQVINSVHGTLKGKPRLKDDAVGALAKSYRRAVATPPPPGDDRMRGSPLVEFFSEHIELLRQMLIAAAKPHIPSITLDVFGFSRGAAEAVAFCHMFDELLEKGKFAGIAASINFLGIFDTVASVFIGDSVAKTLPIPDRAADGHWAWASRILDDLPGCIRSGRHYIAAHEQRMNFPVTTLNGSREFKQVYFPGVHSDVGGGYAPGEGGKGRGAQSEMLSQIPLAYMYKEALLEGVPLLLYDEFPLALKDDFSVSKGLASAWEAYTEALIDRSDGTDHGDRLKRHMKLYYDWRAVRLESMRQCQFFVSASKQSQQDLDDSNRLLKGDLVLMRRRRLPPDARPELDDRQKQSANQWVWVHANDPLDAWEVFALNCFLYPDPPNSRVTAFFDDFMHDSIAGFYLAGEVTEYDKRVKIAEVLKKPPNSLKGFNKKIVEHWNLCHSLAKRKKLGESLNEEELLLAREAETGTPYPIMTDEDTKDMRNGMITTQTSTRREGAVISCVAATSLGMESSSKST